MIDHFSDDRPDLKRDILLETILQTDRSDLMFNGEVCLETEQLPK